MRWVFDHPVGGRDATNKLLQLCQGPSSVVEYAVQLRTLAAESKWNTEVLIAAFRVFSVISRTNWQSKIHFLTWSHWLICHCLSHANWTHRIMDRCCLYCGRPDHFRSTCLSLWEKPGPVQQRMGLWQEQPLLPQSTFYPSKFQGCGSCTMEYWDCDASSPLKGVQQMFLLTDLLSPHQCVTKSCNRDIHHSWLTILAWVGNWTFLRGCFGGPGWKLI